MNELNHTTLNLFTQLTDGSVDCAIAACTECGDALLRRLCQAFLQRSLPMIEVADTPFSEETIKKAIVRATTEFGADSSDVEYLVTNGRLCNSAYSLAGDGIKIRTRSGEVRDICHASDMLDATAFMQDRVKYFLCWMEEDAVR